MPFTIAPRVKREKLLVEQFLDGQSVMPSGRLWQVNTQQVKRKDSLLRDCDLAAPVAPSPSPAACVPRWEWEKQRVEGKAETKYRRLSLMTLQS